MTVCHFCHFGSVWPMAWQIISFFPSVFLDLWLYQCFLLKAQLTYLSFWSIVGFQCVVGFTEIFSRQVLKWLIPAFCWHRSCKVVPWAWFQMKNIFVLVYFFSWICSVVCFVHVSVKILILILCWEESMKTKKWSGRKGELDAICFLFVFSGRSAV